MNIKIHPIQNPHKKNNSTTPYTTNDNNLFDKKPIIVG